MINYYEIAYVCSKLRNCNDKELLELLDSWRGIMNVIMHEESGDKFGITRQYDKDYLRWADKPLKELRQKADILLRIINNKTKNDETA